jgi:hypothetical protein
MANISNSVREGRSRGLDLLRSVYAELYAELGDTFSPGELLKAAQALIEVTRDEYSAKKYQDGVHHRGYYSHEVDTMVRENAWHLMWHERRCDNLGDERLESDQNSMRRLRELYYPDPYYHRG